MRIRNDLLRKERRIDIEQLNRGVLRLDLTLNRWGRRRIYDVCLNRAPLNRTLPFRSHAAFKKLAQEEIPNRRFLMSPAHIFRSFPHFGRVVIGSNRSFETHRLCSLRSQGCRGKISCRSSPGCRAARKNRCWCSIVVRTPLDCLPLLFLFRRRDSSKYLACRSTTGRAQNEPSRRF